MESNFFSTTRFGLYVQKKLIENRSKLRILLLGIAAMHVGLMFIKVLGRGIFQDYLQIIYMMGLYIIGLIAADQALFASKDKLRNSFLVLAPASKFEKLLLAILTASVAFPLVYTGIFYCANWLVYLALSVTGILHVDILSFNMADMVDNVKDLLLFQSLFLLGSIWFKRMSFVKSAATIVAYFMVLSLVGLLLVKSSFMGLNSGTDILGQNFNFNISSEGSTFSWVLIPFFWVVSYFRFSEKQI